MKILLHTTSTDPEFSGDCDYAVVDLTPELIRQIRRRIDLVRQAGEHDDDLYELYFWGGTAEFYDSGLLEACEEVLAAESEDADADQAVRDWMADLDQNGHVLLPAGVDLAKHEVQRTELDQMIVRRSPSGRNQQFDIAWVACPKHSDVYVTTHDLPLAAFEATVRGKAQVALAAGD